jgi:nicotinate-nucleotide adenylyltransferase
MRLGLLGGTFDPIHRGHLDAAHAARRMLLLDQVLFVPAHVPPHRARGPHASAYHRFAMTAIAVLDAEGFLASDAELGRPGPSFSADTLRRFGEDGWHPWELFFITGVDAFAEIATWREYPGLLGLAHFVVVTRPGHAAEELRERLPALAPRFVRGAERGPATLPLGGPDTAIVLLDAPTTAISSTEVRQRLAANQAVSDVMPAGVARYIRQHRLYEPLPAAPQLHGQI